MYWAVSRHQWNTTYSPQIDLLLEFLLAFENYANVDLQGKKKNTRLFRPIIISRIVDIALASGRLLENFCKIPINEDPPTHCRAVPLHEAHLWDGVLGVDGDDDLSSSLVPVKPARHHLFTL